MKTWVFFVGLTAIWIAIEAWFWCAFYEIAGSIVTALASHRDRARE